MRLIEKASGREINVGDRVTSQRGNAGTVEHCPKPHKASSEGRVLVGGREFYVSVFGLEWTEREDRGHVATPTPAEVFEGFTDEEKAMCSFMFPAEKMPPFADAMEGRKFCAELMRLSGEWSATA